MIEGSFQVRCDECGDTDEFDTSGVDFEQFVSHMRHGLWVCVDTDWSLSPVLCPACRERVNKETDAEEARGDR
jgi:hypothetical protein